MAHTPLLVALRRALRASLTEPSSPRHDDATTLSRRRVLAAGGAVLAGALLPGCVSPLRRRGSAPPRIAIVGAGMAGLHAAEVLRRHGVPSTVYEGSSRAGGRIFTARDLLAPGLTTELGGEFIDSSHADVLALANDLGLNLIDVRAASEAALIPEAYFFGGRVRTEAELVAAFRPVAARLQADRAALGDDPLDVRSAAAARALDRITLADYLARLEGESWLRALLEVAYVTEFGLESSEQSALNLLTLIDDDASDGEVALLGDSDERYKIRGGNGQLTDGLAARLGASILLEHRLLAVRDHGAGHRLTFAVPVGGTVEVDADFTILTLPFTVLRDVELPGSLPGWKRRVIDELGYGASAKLLLGVQRRVWRELGFGGNAYSDRPFQLAWDSSRLQPATAGGLTLYSGGQGAIAVGGGSVQEQVDRLLPGVVELWPGLADASNGRTERFHWPSHPWTRAGYACYRPGQWTGLRGTEAKPVGALHFAGEHTSRDFQGYMNGAAETGRLAAEAILQRCGVVDARGA